MSSMTIERVGSQCENHRGLPVVGIEQEQSCRMANPIGIETRRPLAFGPGRKPRLRGFAGQWMPKTLLELPNGLVKLHYCSVTRERPETAEPERGGEALDRNVTTRAGVGPREQ